MMLFFVENVEEFSTGGILGNENSIFNKLAAALETGINPKDQINKISLIEDSVKNLQKTIGSGLILGGDQFRESLEGIYFRTSEVGVQFKDITDVVNGLYKSVGRIIEPEEKVVEQMAVLSKNTGIASEAMGGMVGDFMKLTFSQEKSVDMINKITDRARRAGVNVNDTLTKVQKNLDKVNAYGFKNGVDGLTKMTIQAQQLRTTVEEIGAAQLGQTFWDPEKAIEAAAGMSMLGGAMGGLSNPFQLMNMGANNVEKLQEELINLSASAYKINETTGEVETNFVAQQRLKQQLESLGKGGEYEKFINLGKEAAKQSQIMAEINKSGLGAMFEGEGKTFTEADQRLIASLSEMKDGKVSLKIPGFDNIDNLQETLSKNPNKIKDALEEYQKLASKDEKQIAAESLSKVDSIDITAKIMKETLMRSLSAQERTEVLAKVGGGVEGTAKTVKEQNKEKTEEGLDILRKKLGIFFEQRDRDSNNNNNNNNNNGDESDEMDAFFSDGKKRLSMGKGQMFNFIDEDQAVFAPNLDEKLNVLKTAYLKLKEINTPESLDLKVTPSNVKESTIKNPFESMGSVMSKSETKTEQTVIQRVEGSGTININVNITSSGNLADTLMSDRRFKNELEKEILDTIKHKDILMVKKS